MCLSNWKATIIDSHPWTPVCSAVSGHIAKKCNPELGSVTFSKTGGEGRAEQGQWNRLVPDNTGSGKRINPCAVFQHLKHARGRRVTSQNQGERSNQRGLTTTLL